jgi:hypothetical protein
MISAFCQLELQGIFLTDLTFMEDGNSDKTADGLINFDKRYMLAKVVRTINDFQIPHYHVAPDVEVRYKKVFY